MKDRCFSNFVLKIFDLSDGHEQPLKQSKITDEREDISK